MTEGINPVVVYVGDRAGSAQLQIAVDEHDADGVARLERSIERHLAGARTFGGRTGRDEPFGAERAPEEIAHLGIEAGHDEWCGDRTEQRPQLTAVHARHGAGTGQLRILRAARERTRPRERL